MERIMIGITTYNRLDIIKAMARSLYNSDFNLPYVIRIYDDASSDYSVETLRDIFPNATSIIRNETNYGADKNIAYMYKDFLQHEEDIIFNADSDLLFNKKWMIQGMDYYRKTDGVLSLFNTRHHKVITTIDDLCLKEDLGSAGTFMSRENVKKIFTDENVIDISERLDWQWSELLKKEGVKLYSVKKSLVQHLGIVGQNSFIGNADYGEGFQVCSIADGQVINDILSYSCNHQKRVHTSYSLFPFEKVNQGSRVVIYGAGLVGTDYVKQLKKSGYAKIVGWVDKKNDINNGVAPIEEIDNYDFDYIILATRKITIAKRMMESLHKAFGNKYSEKIICKIDECGISMLYDYR